MAAAQQFFPMAAQGGGPQQGQPQLFLQMRLERRGQLVVPGCGSGGHFPDLPDPLPIKQLEKPVNIAAVGLEILGAGHLPLRAELGGEPFHFRAVVPGFLADQHGSAVRHQGAEALDHAIGAAERLPTGGGIAAGKPGGDADAARHAVQFREGEALRSEDEVRADDARQQGCGFRPPLEVAEPFRFSGVQQGRQPERVPARGAAAVKCVGFPLEAGQHVAQAVEGADLRAAQAQWLRRPAPGAAAKQPAGRQGVCQCLQSHGGGCAVRRGRNLEPEPGICKPGQPRRRRRARFGAASAPGRGVLSSGIPGGS